MKLFVIIFQHAKVGWLLHARILKESKATRQMIFVALPIEKQTKPASPFQKKIGLKLFA